MTRRDTHEDEGATPRGGIPPDTTATTRHDTNHKSLATPRVAVSRRDNSGDSISDGTYRLPGMSPEELRALPAAVPFDPVVPAAFGISRSAAYRALAAGQLPVTPLRIGRRLIVRRADLMTALGVADVPSASATRSGIPDPLNRKDSQ